MGLLSIFKRDRQDAASPDPSPASSPTVQQARTRARRRLIGATLLVLMAIVGFPMLFESQPRPIPVDIPIDIPRAENAPPLSIPPARSQVIVVEPQPAGASAAAPARGESADLGRPEAPAVAASSQRASPPAADREGHAARADGKPPARAAAETSAKPPSAVAASDARASTKPGPADSARARALLEGRESAKPAPAAVPGRFVVQVGAFADPSAAKEVRQKVEKLGMKTYTQVVETSSGSRTRVRIGPLESREQADKVLDRLKAAGVSAAVLTL